MLTNCKNIKNREARLRRAAAKKGLFIRKGFNLVGATGGTIKDVGYVIGTVDGGFIIAGTNLATSQGFQFDLDEAEDFVAEY